MTPITKTRTILLGDLVGSTTQMTRLEAERGAKFYPRRYPAYPGER